MPDAALDATAEALARQILADLPADRPHPRADLARLPGPVARLLHARLDARVDRAAGPPDTPWVDPDDAGLRDAARTWREAARAAARFPADAWEEDVERAAGLALSHLVRPAETLAAYAFETDDDAIAAALALRRIRAFASYPYLPEIAGRYVDRKGLGRIDRAGLERLLRRIDRRMVSAFSADDWMTLLGPLFELVGPLGSPPGAVPTDLLRPLFEAKGADDLADALGPAEALTAADLRRRLDDALPTSAPPTAESDAPLLDSDDTRPLTHREPTQGEDIGPPEFGPRDHTRGDEIADVPEEAHPAAPWEEDEPSAEPEDASPQSGTFVFSAPPDDDPAPAFHDADGALGEDAEAFDDAPEAGAAPTGALPLVGLTDLPGQPLPHFGDDLDDATDEPSAPPDPDDEDEPLWRRLARERGAETVVDEVAEDEAPLWKRFAAPADDDAAAVPTSEGSSPERPAAPSSAPLSTLERRVLGEDGERRGWFVDELFGGSSDEYHRTLASLDAARSWTEATEIIARDVFRKHRVNIYSEPAVAFTDAVESQMTGR